MKTLLMSSMLFMAAAVMAAKPEVIPELKTWTDAPSAAVYTVGKGTQIAVPSGDKALLAHAGVFAQELGTTVRNGAAQPGDIVLKADANDATLGDEGYTLDVTQDGITVRANTPLGAFWGTRSLIQVFRAKNNTFPCGTAKDWPNHEVRGFMFDVGRKAFTMTTIRQIVELMSYYKMNDFQLHLSDNYIWLHNFPGVKTAQDVLKIDPTPGGFRLESKVPGLTSTDMFYTKQDYRDLVTFADARGVTIIPEIDVPGHALPLVKVRPDLMYTGSVGGKHDCERAAMLDLKNPETFPFVASIFDEYIDDGTFSGEVVHIGTDEYYGDAESYRAFADRMLKHIHAKGKTPRLWGSLSAKRGQTPVEGKGSQLNIWSMGWQHPVEAIKLGFDIINIVDVHTYSVPSGNGSVGGYGDDINANWLYDNWTPIAFPGTKPEQIDRSKLLGGAWAIWNDNSFLTDFGLCGRDLLPRIQKNCAVIAQKTWNESRMSTRDYQGFLKLIQEVGTPVDVTIPTWEKTWTVTCNPLDGARVLAEGDETTVYAVSPVNGKVGFRREGSQYTFDYTLPAGKPVALTIKASERKVELFADGQPVGGVPTRQFWPDSCKFFTLPKPE